MIKVEGTNEFEGVRPALIKVRIGQKIKKTKNLKILCSLKKNYMHAPYTLFKSLILVRNKIEKEGEKTDCLPLHLREHIYSLSIKFYRNVSSGRCWFGGHLPC